MLWRRVIKYKITGKKASFVEENIIEITDKM